MLQGKVCSLFTDLRDHNIWYEALHGLIGIERIA